MKAFHLILAANLSKQPGPPLYFCGETYFQHQLPIDSSSMSRWRKRIGEKGCELILAGTLNAGFRSGAVKESSLKRVNVDTTVQPKAIRYPTDSRSYNRCRERLVRLAQKHGIKLRQSYARLGPRALRKASSYTLMPASSNVPRRRCGP